MSQHRSVPDLEHAEAPASADRRLLDQHDQEPDRTLSPITLMRALMEIPPRSIIAAVAAGVATLAAAFALAAVSGWLITTAWTMPPVLDLSIAVVSVRALGISRGVFRYVERMLTHDAALTGVMNLRTNLFTNLSRRTDDHLQRLKRGDLLARIGDDAEDMADDVIRHVIPAIVAAVMAVLVVLTFFPFAPIAALFMLASLLIASLWAPYAAYRAAQHTERALVQRRMRLAAITLDIADNGDAMRVAGTLETALADLRDAQADLDRGLDEAARPSAFAQAGVMLAMIPALVGSILAAGAVHLLPADGFAGGIVPTTAGIVGLLLLLPLSSFEAATVLPAAARQKARSEAAAERLSDIAGTGEMPDIDDDAHRAAALPAVDKGHRALTLAATNLTVGWLPGTPVLRDFTRTFAPGSRTVVLGASGRGKTTLLLTLAGLLAPLRGRVSVGSHSSGQWVSLAGLDEQQLRGHITSYAEDAHLFATSLRENIRVAQRDLDDEQIRGALTDAGLGGWVAGLPGGLDTMLGSGGTDVSGGERRRILLARAIARRSPITILDEPTEHLDEDTAHALMQRILGTGEDALFEHCTVIVVTHDRRFTELGADIIDLEDPAWHA